jgi:hypothetical protein
VPDGFGCFPREAVDGGSDAALDDPLGAVADGLHLGAGAGAAEVDVLEHDAAAGRGVAAGEPDGVGARGRAGDAAEHDAGDADGGGAVRAGGARVAVELVDDDGVVDVLDAHVLEADVAHVSGPALPRLDAHAVLRAADAGAVEDHAGNGGGRAARAQAADADAVAGAALDAAHPHPEAGVGDGDAVVARADAAAPQRHARRLRDVDAVRVRAVRGGLHAEPRQADVARPGHRQVHLLRVLDAEAPQAHAAAGVERHGRRRGLGAGAGPLDLAGVGPPLGAGAVDDAAALDARAHQPAEQQPQPRAPRVPLRRLLRRHDRPLNLQRFSLRLNSSQRCTVLLIYTPYIYVSCPLYLDHHVALARAHEPAGADSVAADGGHQEHRVLQRARLVPRVQERLHATFIIRLRVVLGFWTH